MINVQNMYLKKNLNRGNSHKQISNSKYYFFHYSKQYHLNFLPQNVLGEIISPNQKEKKRGKNKKFIHPSKLNTSYAISAQSRFTNLIILLCSESASRAYPFLPFNEENPVYPLSKNQHRKSIFLFLSTEQHLN